MKKLLALLLAGFIAVSVVGCSSIEETTEETTEGTTEEPTTVSIEVVNGNDEMITVDFPYNPQRIVVLNYQTLDFLDAVGLGDRVVGVIEGASCPEHLKHYTENPDIVTVGGMKEYDMEAIMSLQPDAIFSSDRSAGNYDEFMLIAPTMAAYVDYEAGFYTSFVELAQKHATIFGLTDELNDTLADYQTRLDAIAEVANGSTALLGIYAGGLNTLGDTGRASIVTNEMGFTNLAAEINVNHGNVSSHETFLAVDPEYIFILDKDTAVGEEAVAAKEQMNTETIQKTQAYQNDNIIYLEPGNCWYVADGGIGCMDQMITGIEEALEIK